MAKPVCSWAACRSYGVEFEYLKEVVGKKGLTQREFHLYTTQSDGLPGCVADEGPDSSRHFGPAAGQTGQSARVFNLDR